MKETITDYKQENKIETITIEEVKTIYGYADSVISLFLLKDNRIAACSDDKTKGGLNWNCSCL